MTTLDPAAVLERVGQFHDEFSLSGLTQSAAVEATDLLPALLTQLDRNNPAQAKAYRTAEPITHMGGPLHKLAPLWHVYRLLTDTDDRVLLELNLWMSDCQRAIQTVAEETGGIDDEMILVPRYLSDQADMLMPRVVNRFGHLLPDMVACYRQPGPKPQAQNLELLSDALVRLAG